MAAVELAEDHAGLVLLRSDPLNCETPIPELQGGAVMPSARFYIRNHFPMPAIDADRWRMSVTGLVGRPLALSLRELLEMQSRVLTVTLECAGNGRSMLSPRVDGEQWGLGAVSTAEWTGVPLSDLLDRAGIEPPAREVLFRGADREFERSLTVADARSANALLAYAMNGEPLSIQHGYPLRLIVPSWYAVASVKWLTDIEVIGHAFKGHFQTEKYTFETERDGALVREPVRLQRVRAMITKPAEGDVISTGSIAIRGVAWSGSAPIARVDVSVDGSPWRRANLLGEVHRHGWRRWELVARVDRAGLVKIRARASDEAGRTQPETPEWNRLGYGNNAIQEVAVRAN